MQQDASYVLEYNGITEYSIGDQLKNHISDAKGSHYIKGCPIVTNIELDFTPFCIKTYIYIKDFFPQP